MGLSACLVLLERRWPPRGFDSFDARRGRGAPRERLDDGRLRRPRRAGRGVLLFEAEGDRGGPPVRGRALAASIGAQSSTRSLSKSPPLLVAVTWRGGAGGRGLRAACSCRRRSRCGTARARGEPPVCCAVLARHLRASTPQAASVSLCASTHRPLDDAFHTATDLTAPAPDRLPHSRMLGPAASSQS